MSEIKRPTKADIAAWKKQYPEGIHKVTVGEKYLILRQPGMVDLERAMAADPKKKKPMNFNRSIVQNCKLYADPGIIEDDQSYLAVCSNIDEIIQVAEATVEKL